MSTPRSILDARSAGSFVLTVAFADLVNAVARNFPGNLSLNDVYFSITPGDQRVGEAWFNLVRGELSRVQRGCLTRALLGVSTRLKVRDLRNVSVEDLIGWKVRQTTAAFLILAFRADNQ